VTFASNRMTPCPDTRRLHVVEDSAADGNRPAPHPAHCLPWCTECRHDDEPSGTLLHRGPADTVDIYGERPVTNKDCPFATELCLRATPVGQSARVFLPVVPTLRH
jgi:hypothetical protein